MSYSRPLGSVTAAVVLAVSLGACSGGDGADEAGDPTTSAAENPATTVATTTTTIDEDATGSPPAGEPQEQPSAVGELAELRSELGIAALELNPTTETGMHPTLSWDAVAGAASYWLVVRDADLRPYWAWTGADLGVRLGGGDTPDTNQTAALHETMTWRVAAFDAEGSLIALSERATLSP